MSDFNLKEYEIVKERKKRFYKDYPDGRIIVENVSDNVLEYAFIKCTIYKSKEDHIDKVPFSTGYALEIRDKELSTSKKGNKYATVNYTSWVENCEESSIGRALDNASYSSNNKCSREEMEKVKRHETIIKEKVNLDKAIIELGECDNLKTLGLKAKELNEKYNWTDTERNEMKSVYKEIASGFTKN